MNRYFTKILSLFLLFIFLQSEAVAQNGIVRGIVSDRQTGDALVTATVSIQPLPEGNLRGEVTDNNGHFQISRIEQGRYEFLVRYLGYETFRDTIEVTRAEQVLLRNVQLRPSSEELGEVEVLDRAKANNAGQIKIQPETIGRVPTPGGSADFVSYIQNQPGVLATGDRGGQLFVRGGTPAGNLVLMDGSLIYQPFHIVGFFSVFPEEVVSSADFYAGGFGAEYSERSSSVMDIRLKNGNLYEPGWAASISPFISDLFFESPIKEGKSSVLVSMRGSLIEATSAQYLQEQQPLRFNSQLVKYNSTSNEGLGCSALMMRTYDRGKLDFQSDQYFKWSNFVTGGRCSVASEESSLSFMEMNFGLSHFNNEAGGEEADTRKSSIFKSNLDIQFAHYLGHIRLDYGLFTNFRTVNYDVVNRFVSLDESETSFLTTGAFVEFEVPVGRYLQLKPGVVGTSYLNRLSSKVEPRFRVSLDFSEEFGTALHGAAGIYYQPVIGLSDLRDAGTAFTAWMLSPDEDRVLKTFHYLLGIRQSITRYFDISVEGFHKKIENTPVSVWNPIAEFTTDLAYADGNVNGVDARLDLTLPNFYAAIGYGYSITEYESTQDHFMRWYGEPSQTYNPSHDRRHQVNAQLGFDFKAYSLNLNWIYGSGMPYTRPMGFDSFFNLEEGIPTITEDYGDPRILLEKPLQGRMPDFHRLDVSVERLIKLQRTNMKLQLGAINTYDQKNLFYYDVFYQRGINQLPVVPYLSLKIGTK